MTQLGTTLGLELPFAMDRWTEPFWAAAQQERLVIVRCSDCAHFRSPPTAFCPRCLSQQVEWIQLSGGAELYSFTVVRHAAAPALAGAIPYVIGIVVLDGTSRTKFMTNVVNCEINDVHIGMRLHVVWDTSGSQTVPRFGP